MKPSDGTQRGPMRLSRSTQIVGFALEERARQTRASHLHGLLTKAGCTRNIRFSLSRNDYLNRCGSVTPLGLTCLTRASPSVSPWKTTIKSAFIMGIRRITNEFMTHGKELLRRLRSTEGNTLTETDLRMLRVQLHLLDIEAASRQYMNTPGTKNTVSETQ